MNELRFLVQGSAVEPYQVVFRKNGNNLTATCSCPAGQIKKHCKHRLNLLLGEPLKIVENAENTGQVPIIAKGTDVEDSLNAYLRSQVEGEKLIKEIKDQQRRLRDKMNAALNN
jgi:uncharacterized Zn finger protein